MMTGPVASFYGILTTTHMRTAPHKHTRTHAHTCTRTHTHTRMNAHIHARTHIHTWCTRTHHCNAHTHMHTHARTYTRNTTLPLHCIFFLTFCIHFATTYCVFNFPLSFFQGHNNTTKGMQKINNDCR